MLDSKFHILLTRFLHKMTYYLNKTTTFNCWNEITTRRDFLMAFLHEQS